MKNKKEACRKLFKEAGIEINGTKPWDIQVHNERFYSKIMSIKSGGSLALGESYMDGWWDAKSLDQFFFKLTSKKPKIKVISPGIILEIIANSFINFQSKKRSKKVAQRHYDLGNDFYKKMLDKYMQYTCGYWKNAKNLNQAQENKMDLICRKLHLKKKNKINKRERILELGSGFGGFSKFATEKYNCEITSYNISKEQIKYGKEINKNLPVKIIESDYREAINIEKEGSFDKIVSVGMYEHVGPKNYNTFMNVAHKCLKNKGLFLLHTIGRQTTLKQGKADPWIKKYIFPEGHLPSPAELISASEPYFKLEDAHNFGRYYDLTLMAWFDNFEKNWKEFKNKFGDRFYRMWKYYLLSCAGAFRSGSIDLYQFVFSKGDLGNVYEAVR